jgi:AraC-like DNA-binding protein
MMHARAAGHGGTVSVVLLRPLAMALVERGVDAAALADFYQAAELREDVRKTLADRYLHEGLSFAEISFLLGFSEPSAFFRAFKRWTGLTPYERRASLAMT